MATGWKRNAFRNRARLTERRHPARSGDGSHQPKSARSVSLAVRCETIRPTSPWALPAAVAVVAAVSNWLAVTGLTLHLSISLKRHVLPATKSAVLTLCNLQCSATGFGPGSNSRVTTHRCIPVHQCSKWQTCPISCNHAFNQPATAPLNVLMKAARRDP